MGKKTNYKITKPKYLSFSSIIFVILIVGIFIMLRKYVCFDRNMFFYFFASTSQSMAALFAVGGLFAVFRFQAQEVKLRNLYDSHKKWFDDWLPYIFGMEKKFDTRVRIGFDTKLWKDNQIVDIGKSIVKERRAYIADAKKKKRKINPDLERLIDGLEERINEIEYHQKRKDFVLEGVKLPMLVILITFMISIGSLPFTSYISENFLGLIILILTMALITYSIWCVFTFIRFSLSLK